VDLGRIGVWSSYRAFGAERAGEAAKLLEQLGYGTWWVGSSPHVSDLRPVLEATSTLVAATGILNVWANEPAETAAADAVARADFPGRVMLRIGIGHREATQEYRAPLATMRKFLDGLDASETPPPADERCLAALGPKMLELAGDRTAGTHTYFVPVAVIDPSALTEYAKYYLQLRNYAQNLLEHGFTEDDIADGGSDRLIDAIVPQGSAEQIAELVHAHIDAGADHVALQPLGEDGVPREGWTALARALIV
jgi:alkanesulfonate monooxygenase SsuD/methylene tetrahydromethanopterin reductase-like flavin-dependent oxidoreductase (luciferase family)